MVAIGLIEDFVSRGIGRCETARGVGLADRKEAIAPAFLGVEHLFFGDVVVHAHRLAVGQCGTGSRNQQGQHQSAVGGGQTNIHDDSVSQRPWNCKGSNGRFSWQGLPMAASKDSWCQEFSSAMVFAPISVFAPIRTHGSVVRLSLRLSRWQGAWGGEADCRW